MGISNSTRRLLQNPHFKTTVRTNKGQQSELLKGMDERGCKWEGVKRLKSISAFNFCTFIIPEKEYAIKAAESLPGAQRNKHASLPEGEPKAKCLA